MNVIQDAGLLMVRDYITEECSERHWSRFDLEVITVADRSNVGRNQGLISSAVELNIKGFCLELFRYGSGRFSGVSRNTLLSNRAVTEVIKLPADHAM